MNRPLKKNNYLSMYVHLKKYFVLFQLYFIINYFKANN